MIYTYAGYPLLLSIFSQLSKKLFGGRKEGFRKTDSNILEEYSDVVKYLKKGRSIREIMKLTNRSNGTIMKVKRLLD